MQGKVTASMRIIPVMDLIRGQVVRGVAGRRDEYRPVQSILAADARPRTVAQAFAERGFREVYIADLDAIGGAQPTPETYEVIAGFGLSLWIDAGLADLTRTAELADLRLVGRPVAGIIAGLESMPDFHMLAAMLDRVGSERLVFSLDLKAGRPLTRVAQWQELTPLALAERAIGTGVRRMIVLDLAQVGMNAGVSATSLCRELREKYPHLELTSGGGVRNEEDLQRLADSGCNAALVASALHDGRLPPLAEYPK